MLKTGYLLRILLLTGRLAEPAVRAAVDACPPRYDVRVLRMPIDVAALATPQLTASYLKKTPLGDYDLIMVSGAIQGSMKPVEDAVGVRVVKGPKHAVDIPLLLQTFDPRRLSPDISADALLIEELRRNAKEILKETERLAVSKPHICIGGIRVPVDPPPIRVISEVTEAHLLSEEELVKAVGRRIEEGADIVGLGFQAGAADPGRVRRYVRLLKEEYDFPLMLDSVIPSEIIAGVEAGVDMVMSLEAGNIRKVADKIRRTPAVVIPYDSRRDFFARTVDDKLRLLEMNLKLALKHKVENLIADPVLEPLNPAGPTRTFQSLRVYYLFKQRMPDVPLLMGLCNVVEMIDADSVGVNALLTMLAAEMGISLVLVVDKSAKATGSTSEAKISAQMAAIAWKKQTSPKDLGLDLLILKDKRMVDVNLDIEGAETIEVKDKGDRHLQDPLGFFTVRVDREDGMIEVLYKGVKGKLLIRGRKASSIYGEILRRNLVSVLSHAFYLGVELGRAEEALRTGKSYVQEEILFERARPIDPYE
jgi:dihydropteroate synthase-like protein